MSDINIKDGCSKCQKAMKYQVKCSICKRGFHLKCSKITSQDSDVWLSWFCGDCSAEFPFHMLDDEHLLSVHNKNTMDRNFYENILIFHPFDLNDLENSYNGDFDPDINFFSGTLNGRSCKYYSEEKFNLLLESSSNDSVFSVLNLNIRSLTKNYDHLGTFLSTLNHSFSVIGLSETWLTENSKESGLYELPGYNSVHAIRQSRTGGGVSIFVKQNLNFIQRDDLILNNDEGNVESIFVELETSKSKNIVIGQIYKPPDVDIIKFNDGMNTVLSKVNQEDKICYILGDFNINILKSEIHCPTNEFLNMLQANYFFPAIDKPTRITRQSATLIDNILFNTLDYETMSGLLFTDITDHLPVFLFAKLNNKEKKSPVETQYYRNFCKSNKNKFKKMMQDISFDEVYNEKDPNSAYEVFMKLFSSCFDKCFPLISGVVLTNNPWFTSGLKKSSRIKNKLYKKYLSCPTPLNLATYKSYKNKFAHLLRISKKKYYNNQFKKYSNNIKNTWKTINQLLQRKKAASKFPSTFVDGNSVLSDPYKIVCHFNNFFSNIGSKLANEIQNTTVDPIDYIKESFPIMDRFDMPNSDEVCEVIMQLKESAPGHDGIRASLVQNVVTLLSKPLTHIFALSMTTSIVPTDLKVAKVIPLFKTGDPSMFTNYRPVSVLPCFSKILEKLIYKRLLKHLNTHNIIYQYQYGFRKNHSTYMALVELTDRILTALNNNEYTLGVFLDLSKAFDTVHHEILLKKLFKYGFQGLVHKWLIHYVKNRYQYVSMNGLDSKKNAIQFGVPQGSILGPLLFLVFINDLANVTHFTIPILFADDTNLLISHKDLTTLTEKLNRDLAQYSTWFQANKLSLNVKKCNFMVFAGRRNYIFDDIRICIQNQQIDKVSSVRFLGVQLDDKLMWKDHIGTVCKKVTKSLGILRRIRHFVHEKVMLTLYYSLIYPYLSYCNVVWASTFPTHLKKILLLQKAFVRLATFSKFDAASAPLFSKLQLLNIYEINIYQTCSFVLLIKQGQSPDSFKNYFVKNCQVHSYNTRQALLFHLPLSTKTQVQFSFRHHGAKLWNKYGKYMESTEINGRRFLKKVLLSKKDTD